MERLLLSRKEVAQLLGCSVRTIEYRTAARRMPQPIMCWNQLRWRLTDLQEWVEQGCPEDAEPRTEPHRAAN